MPATFYDLENKKAYDWGYYAEQSLTGSLGMKSGGFWPRGKMLGGSSGINAMLYVRGNRRDYDHWLELGNPTWDWDSVLRYFKKSENNTMPTVVGDGRHHGTGGPLKVGSFNSDEPMKKVIEDIVSELGYKRLSDINGDEHLGFVSLQGTVDGGTRYSSAKAFLLPAATRPNLHIIKHAHATRLEFNKKGDVNGIQFVVGEKELTAYAGKEVILSAGALNTPQLMMLSGIGPQEELNKFNIDIKRILEVGENLQDHLVVPYVTSFHRSNPRELTTLDLTDAMYQFLTRRGGLLASTGATDFSWFISTEGDGRYPDIQYHVFYLTKKNRNADLIFRTFGYKEDIIESLVSANENAELVLWIVTLLTPKSVGTVRLRSADPMDSPKIDHNYLKDFKDLKTMVQAIRVLRDFAKTKTYVQHEGGDVRMTLPDCDKFEYDSDLYWQCYVRHMTSTLYHPVGTAKMGTDEKAVVDSRLKVHGVSGLRVADCSIMPKIVSGNTNAPAMMIGEKAADFIKEDWTVEEPHVEL